MEVVARPRLVVNGRDHAGARAAEFVLGRRVRIAIHGPDVLGHAVRALDLVETAAVIAGEDAHGAVGSDTRMARAPEYVARQGRCVRRALGWVVWRALRWVVRRALGRRAADGWRRGCAVVALPLADPRRAGAGHEPS